MWTVKSQVDKMKRKIALDVKKICLNDTIENFWLTKFDIHMVSMHLQLLVNSIKLTNEVHWLQEINLRWLSSNSHDCCNAYLFSMESAFNSALSRRKFMQENNFSIENHVKQFVGLWFKANSILTVLLMFRM